MHLASLRWMASGGSLLTAPLTASDIIPAQHGYALHSTSVDHKRLVPILEGDAIASGAVLARSEIPTSSLENSREEKARK